MSDFIHRTMGEMLSEKALAWLKVNPRRISTFEKYPDNWQELMQEAVTSEAPVVKKRCTPCERKNLEKSTVSELQSQYPEVVYKIGTKKSDYIDAIIDFKYPAEQ